MLHQRFDGNLRPLIGIHVACEILADHQIELLTTSKFQAMSQTEYFKDYF